MNAMTSRPGCTDAELAVLEEPCCLGWGKGWHEYDCPDHADGARDQISDAIDQLILPDLPEGTKVFWQEPRGTASALVVVEDRGGSCPYFISVECDRAGGVSCRSSQGDAWEVGWEA